MLVQSISMYVYTMQMLATCRRGLNVPEWTIIDDHDPNGRKTDNPFCIDL